MARKPRIEFEGAFYHVISRGNQRQKIFRDDDDYRHYLDILSYYKDRYKFSLYCYALMSNHLHLLLETRKIPLSKMMQGISQRYTIYFNKKYQTVGHLFQGRYKALLCDKDAYLLTLIKYIHLNPVRAKMVKDAEEYPWSSHRFYIKRVNGKELLDTGQVLRMFSDDPAKGRKLYHVFMSDGVTIKKDDIYGAVDQRIVGDEMFAEDVRERHELELGNIRKTKARTLEEIAGRTEDISGVGLDELRRKGKGRKKAMARKLCSLAAKEYGYKGTEISSFLRKDPAVISRYLSARTELLDALGQVLALLK
jgi:putative transposase